MELFANIRPIKAYAQLSASSPLKPEVRDGADFIIVRELLGGIYFGEPRGIENLKNGERRGFNTQSYSTSEIHRIGKVAFDLALARRKQVMSVDKANVMESSALWREEMEKLRAENYPQVALDHLYVDACSIEIVKRPKRFDVMVTDNLFGDILSDCASVVTGSIGMLPSASLSEVRANGRPRAFYEPVHGSAPDIAGTGKANPCAAILSVSMALELSLHRPEDARLLERAVEQALTTHRTPDMAAPDAKIVSTSDFGSAVIASLNQLSGVS
jgi:3-isopropylmalate dehydrogenase